MLREDDAVEDAVYMLRRKEWNAHVRSRQESRRGMGGIMNACTYGSIPNKYLEIRERERTIMKVQKIEPYIIVYVYMISRNDWSSSTLSLIIYSIIYIIKHYI